VNDFCCVGNASSRVDENFPSSIFCHFLRVSSLFVEKIRENYAIKHFHVARLDLPRGV
jgi:hypothetical protein